jgi:hypothetical protein
MKDCDAQRSDVHLGHLIRLSAMKNQELIAFPSLRDQPRLTEPFRQHDLEEQGKAAYAKATASTT